MGVSETPEVKADASRIAKLHSIIELYEVAIPVVIQQMMCLCLRNSMTPPVDDRAGTQGVLFFRIPSRDI